MGVEEGVARETIESLRVVEERAEMVESSVVAERGSEVFEGEYSALGNCEGNRDRTCDQLVGVLDCVAGVAEIGRVCDV